MPPVNLGYHLVVYIDLLGQSGELEKIRDVPTTEAEKAEAWAVIERTAMRVEKIRVMFQSMVDRLTTTEPNPAILAALPPESP